LTDRIDFIICLGGDGTLLYASLLFQQSVPPVMAFHLGSLGFLTPFQFHNFQDQVTNVLEGHAALTLRSRLRCIIVRKNEKKDGEGQNGRAVAETSSINSLPSTNILVLNEVVIDRGPSPYLSNIDLFLDGKHITSVQGDGACPELFFFGTHHIKFSRSYRFDSYGINCICSGRWSFNDSSKRACRNGDTNLPTFTKFPTNSCTSWSRVEDFHLARQSQYILGIF
jgi:ATP-NAD kinase N-terminal domain